MATAANLKLQPKANTKMSKYKHDDMKKSHSNDLFNRNHGVFALLWE